MTSLIIGWLYPDLMSTYGDRGNIICLAKRCQWRKIEVKVLPIQPETRTEEIEKVDLILGGGAQDRQQEIVMRDLKGVKGKVLKELIENGKPGIFTCGAPQLLGHYYEPTFGQRIEGLGIFDLVSVAPGPEKHRCIGNIVIEIQKSKIKNRFWASQNDEKNYLVGFENHGGRTYLGKNLEPLGTVVKGFGNNGEDKTEGAVYKNSVATYLHGPVLPKNPHLADWLIEKALAVKYGKKIELERLDDDLEWKAHQMMVKRILNNK